MKKSAVIINFLEKHFILYDVRDFARLIFVYMIRAQDHAVNFYGQEVNHFLFIFVADVVGIF